jgi:hypothetical protein
MAKTSLIDEELWKKVKEDRLREEQRRAPLLAAYRATKEELEIRAVEDDKQATLGTNKLLSLGEGIARSGRESVRFERYLVHQGFYPNIPKTDPLGLTDKASHQ